MTKEPSMFNTVNVDGVRIFYGHFALETHVNEIGAEIHRFLDERT